GECVDALADPLEGAAGLGADGEQRGDTGLGGLPAQAAAAAGGEHALGDLLAVQGLAGLAEQVERHLPRRLALRLWLGHGSSFLLACSWWRRLRRRGGRVRPKARLSGPGGRWQGQRRRGWGWGRGGERPRLLEEPF